MNDELLAYVWKHREEDVRKLALSGRNDAGDLDFPSALKAIQARQKLKLKHPEWYAVPEVFVPEAVVVEQSSSPETAAYKSQFVPTDGTVLDLSGGMGADSFAFAKVAKAVTYLELSQERAELAAHNFKALGCGNIYCHTGAAEVEGLALAKELQPNLIYLDPDRRPSAARSRVFRLEDSRPDLTTLLPQLLAVSPSSEVLVKLSPMADLAYLEGALHFPFDTHIVSLRREAKELLLHFSPTATQSVTVVEIGRTRTITCTTDGHTTRPVEISHRVGQYLYDLYPAFAKVGYERLGLDDPVWQPARHTHLYFSEELLPDFPGRAFELLEHNLGEKRWLKEVSRQPLHLQAKNLPTSTDQLRRQLKVKEGGDLFLFAYADEAGKRNFVLARRVEPTL